MAGQHVPPNYSLDCFSNNYNGVEVAKSRRCGFRCARFIPLLLHPPPFVERHYNWWCDFDNGLFILNQQIVP